MDQTAQADRAAVEANAEIVQTQIETTQNAMRSGSETWARTFEGMTQAWTGAFGVATPKAELADEAVQNVRAVSEASTILAKGAQDASRAWFELTQWALRTNLEALGQLANCRSPQEVVTVQSNLLSNNLQQVMESGQSIARASSDAIREATQAMQCFRRKPSAKSMALTESETDLRRR